MALVPTMGALHDGHLSLVRLARRRARRVVVSIFINPTQFAPHEDLSSYPRSFEADLDALARERVDLVFASPSGPPRVAEAGATAPIEVPAVDAPEVLVDGVVDLGAIATEFLILGIDPYPRKADAVFEPPAADGDTGGPFAALAALQKKRGGEPG